MSIDLREFKRAYKKWSEESLPDYRAGNMTEIVKRYPFVVSTDVPWTPYHGRLSEQTVALVTSAGLYLKGSQPPFDTASIHGDPSVRKLPRSVRQEEMGIAHAHYDHTLAEQDVNIVFPLARLLELEKEGIIGRVAETHYSFSYVNDVTPLVTDSAPRAISRMKAEGVDVVLLVPV